MIFRAGFFSGRISQFKEQLQQYAEHADSSESDAQERRTKADAEWDELNKPDDSWKKKALYD